MTEEEVIRAIAFLQCDLTNNPRPCIDCLSHIKKDIVSLKYIDARLIEDVAICIANNSGNYVANKLTPLELSFAFSLLEDIVPHIAERVKADGSG